MLDTSVRQVRSATAVTVIAGVAALLVLAFSAYFATLQNVWIDESTQLLGSSVSLPRMLVWLAGGFEPFGVPGDRMPPISYAVDWACAHSVCAQPLDFRILHSAIAATGVFLVARLAGQRHGPVAAIVTGLMLALLPQTVLTAAEIRAYPIFLTLTAVQLILLYRLVDRSLSWRSLLVFSAVGLVSVYTHFFGLVASSAMFCGLIVARARSRGGLLMILAAWALLLLLSAGLVPFIFGAQSVSNPAEIVPVDFDSITTYLGRIVGSAPMLLLLPVSIAFFSALALLLAVLIVMLGRDAIRTPTTEPLEPEVAIVVAIVAGITVSIGAALFMSGFNPMKPSYSIWLLPPLALLAGAAAARGRIAAAIAAVMLLALLPIQANFLRHADLFVHGPERAIDDALGHDPRGAAIVYAGGGWAFAYFPMVYRHGDKLPQYWIDPLGQLRPVGYGGDPNLLPVAPASLNGYRRLLVVSVAPRTGNELRGLLAGQAPAELVNPIALDTLPIDGDAWRPVEEIIRPGLYWLRLTRLEKK